MDKFILIDGNSLINRGFYATPPMLNSKGVPTNAVYAFCNMLIKLIGEVSPKYILVAFDRKEPTFRHKIYSEYKGTRKPSPEELRSQIFLLKDVLTAMGISHFELASYEADDIIGTLAKRCNNCKTIIITGDKDCLQLVDDSTEVYFTKRGISDVDVYSAQNFTQKTGLTPSQIIDFKALMGDSSDNIPGVAGVGEKTAKELITVYQSVANIYNNLDDIKGKLKEKLENSKDICELSRVLATINTQVPIEKNIEDFTYSFPFEDRTREIFSELEFRNLLKKEELFSGRSSEGGTVKKHIEKRELLKSNEIMSNIKNSRISVVISDFVSFYDFNNVEYELHIQRDFFDEGFSFEEAIEAVRPIFENSENTVILYNKNQIRHLLDNYGIKFLAACEDISLLKYLVDYTGKDDKLSDVLTTHGLDAKAQASSLAELFESYMTEIKEDEKKLYYDLELPLCDVLFEMEKSGFKVDQAELYTMGNLLKSKIDELHLKINYIAKSNFNPASPKQLEKVLFEELKLSRGKKNKSGSSTAADVLENIADEHEIVPLILQYRQLTKLYSTYIEGFLRQIDNKTGLIHTTFNQALTSTGRLSSREPNLQNIPVRTEEGRKIRKLFVPRDEEHILIDADYSQIELRLLAHFSQSETLIEAFKNGVDIHSVTASEVFGVSLGEVTKEMRTSAKAANFGIIYGISDFGFAKSIKASVKTAGEYIKKYFEAYPRVKEYMDKNVEFAQKNGYAVTLLGRKRYIREINSTNYSLRQFGERAAMNMPLQGTAADIIKIAMVNVAKKLKDEGFKSKLILQVHDELIIDALRSESEEVMRMLVYEMENAVSLTVPLTVDAKLCECWYDAK